MKTWSMEETPAGTVHLNLWFTGAEKINAANAKEHPRIVQAIAKVNEIYAGSTIQIGNVTYNDLPEETPESVETTLEKDSDLSKLFMEVSPDAPPGINVMFVSTIVKTELKDGATGIVLGIAGGIPGPPFTHHGSPHSGVAVSLTDTKGKNDRLGSTLAHEIGHYLGLYHTTENNKGKPPEQKIHDPIADTPEDDKTNLMWWAAEGGVALTKGQSFVMLRHPSVFLKTADVTPDP